MPASLNRQQRRQLEQQRARHRAQRRVERPMRTPMLVGADLVLRPLESIIDRLEIDGTVEVDSRFSTPDAEPNHCRHHAKSILRSSRAQKVNRELVKRGVPIRSLDGDTSKMRLAFAHFNRDFVSVNHFRKRRHLLLLLDEGA